MGENEEIRRDMQKRIIGTFIQMAHMVLIIIRVLKIMNNAIPEIGTQLAHPPNIIKIHEPINATEGLE